MGKKVVIIFTDVPYITDFFGMTMSGASASFEIPLSSWDGVYLDFSVGSTKESATTGLYNYMTGKIPVGSDITVSKTSDTVYLFSESCTSVKFYSGTPSSQNIITSGDLYHIGYNTKYANVSSQTWSGNYSVGSNIINLTWSGASDPENSIKGYDLYYKLATSTTWIFEKFITTTDGGANYDFVINQQVTHNFAVQTVDTSNLRSEYKYYTQIISPVFKISSTSNSVQVSSCNLIEPITPVYLDSLSTIPSKGDSVYKNSNLTAVFDGTRNNTSQTSPGQYPRNWKLGTPTNTFYNCTIDGYGKITNIPTECTVSYKSGKISTKVDLDVSACNVAISNTNIYWDSTKLLAVNTILYTDATLTNTVLQGYYRVHYQDPVSLLDEEYIVKIGSTGIIVTRLVPSVFCVPTPTNSGSTTGGSTTGGSSGGGGGGGGCVDPLVSILLPNGITKFAGEVEVNDIILTIHDITKELGEFKVLSKEIVTQPKVIIKFTDGTEIKVSDTHKFLMSDNTWKQIFSLKGNETVKGLEIDKTIIEIIRVGEGDVVMFEIEEAHTYISDGLISHNNKAPISAIV